MKYLTPALTALSLLAGTAAYAAPVNGTGFLTSDVIFGSGNANGSFSGDTGGGIEVALRSKLRYDLSGNPQNIFNYDGIDTYTFDPANGTPPAGASMFNFEFSLNSDTGGTLNRNVNDIVWSLMVDTDPSAAVTNSILSGDPINGVPFADHSFGNNTTANGVGAEAAFLDFAGYNLLRASNNVAQNSYNLNLFSFTAGLPGIYTISLSGSDDSGVLASTSINVVVAPSVVPLPATLPLLLGSAALFGTIRKRHKS